MAAPNQLQGGAVIRLPKGKLAGIELRTTTDAELRGIAQSTNHTEVAKVSFYGGNLAHATFQGIKFIDSNLARVAFEDVTFSRCKFECVDLTRASFKNCSFSDCRFVNCDPYYTSFEKTEIDPAAFRRCFASHDEWNKALLLFSVLRLQLKEMGETRYSRMAEYWFRVWQRRRLYNRWRLKRVAGFGSWFGSLCLGALTGYGERPIYLAGWALGVVTIMSRVYMAWIPEALPTQTRHSTEFWYYSFRVFFGQGFTPQYSSAPLAIAQIGEFSVGLIMVALLIGSVARKLSP